MSEKTYDQMSDEELLAAPPPAEDQSTPAPQAPETKPEPEAAPVVEQPKEEVPPAQITPPAADAPKDSPKEETDEEALASKPPGSKEEKKPEEQVQQQPAKEAPKDQPKEQPADGGPKEEKTYTPEDHKKFFDTVMNTEFKAAGKVFKARTPEEVISLMQKGAGFNRKMEELAPQRQTIETLRQHGMLDKDKIALAIDLVNGDKSALLKVMKDKGIDPLDLGGESPTEWQPVDRTVDPTVIQLQDVMAEVRALPSGTELVQSVIEKWDDASKDLVYKDPTILQKFYRNSQNGINGLIEEEMEHQRTLGNIPANAPYWVAYVNVGDYLAAQGKFAALAPAEPKVETTTQPAPEPTVVATKPEAPRSQVSQDPRARQATPTTGKPAPGKPSNLVGLSDEDFLKQPPPPAS